MYLFKIRSILDYHRRTASGMVPEKTTRSWEAVAQQDAMVIEWVQLNAFFSVASFGLYWLYTRKHSMTDPLYGWASFEWLLIPVAFYFSINQYLIKDYYLGTDPDDVDDAVFSRDAKNWSVRVRKFLNNWFLGISIKKYLCGHNS